jgi:hypothetical protein
MPETETVVIIGHNIGRSAPRLRRDFASTELKQGAVGIQAEAQSFHTGVGDAGGLTSRAFFEIFTGLLEAGSSDPYADGKALSFSCKAQSSLLQY